MPTSLDNAFVTRNDDIDETGDVQVAYKVGLTGISAAHLVAGKAYLRIYDKATAPVAGDTPVMKIVLNAGVPTALVFDPPIQFNNGIGVRATAVFTAGDNTAPALNEIAANFFHVNIPK